MLINPLAPKRSNSQSAHQCQSGSSKYCGHAAKPAHSCHLAAVSNNPLDFVLFASICDANRESLFSLLTSCWILSSPPLSSTSL